MNSCLLMLVLKAVQVMEVCFEKPLYGRPLKMAPFISHSQVLCHKTVTLFLKIQVVKNLSTSLSVMMLFL